MEEYGIVFVNFDFTWQNIPVLNVNNILWEPDAGVRMTQQLAYDSDNLYIHQQAVEKHIRACNTEVTSRVCDDSCMEFFFCPYKDDDRYFNFEWNINGCLHLGFNAPGRVVVRLLYENAEDYFNFRAQYTDDGWELFYKIPLEFIKSFFPEFKMANGTVIRANCFKCGDLTVKPHYLSWNRCTAATPCFHRTDDFGKMIFL